MSINDCIALDKMLLSVIIVLTISLLKFNVIVYSIKANKTLTFALVFQKAAKNIVHN